MIVVMLPVKCFNNLYPQIRTKPKELEKEKQIGMFVFKMYTYYY